MQGSGVNGNFPMISQVTSAAATLTFLGAGTDATQLIFGDGLPWFNVWFRQLTGAAGVALAEYQFQQGLVAGNSLDWAPFPPLADPVSTVPTFRNFKLGAPRYRIFFTVTGACTIQYRTTASI